MIRRPDIDILKSFLGDDSFPNSSGELDRRVVEIEVFSIPVTPMNFQLLQMPNVNRIMLANYIHLFCVSCNKAL